ncbi:MAG: penicillin-binding protein 1A [Hyphomonadaceae bacterium]|nr:penicillin-binding protein 1A [Hyphomonadaceae bacterium]
MAAAKKRRFLTWTLVRRLFIFFAILGVLGIAAIFLVIAALSRDLPTIERLAGYEPPITSRVHAGDGRLIAEFAGTGADGTPQYRVYVPFESIPDNVVNAFVAAEDKKFFEHGGLDYVGIVRGGINSVRNKITRSGGLQGGSTITQQVVKNMLLTRDQTIVRKIKEAVLSRRVERAFTKEEILELYLNEIYLGGRSYGIGSAALEYFNKSLTELNLSEAAILASLAKAPGTVNPYTRPERLLQRRNYVLGRMVEDGYITQEEADEAMAQPLTTTGRLRGAEYEAATYFVQELRQDLLDTYGEDALEDGGLSIRTTIDTNLQLAATTALRNGLVAYDRRHGYRGPLAQIDLEGDALQTLADFDMPAGHGDWEAALITAINGNGSAAIKLADDTSSTLFQEDVAWTQETYDRDGGGSGLLPGDVILVEVARSPADLSEEELLAIEAAEAPSPKRGSALAVVPPLTVPAGRANLRQLPQVEGALVAMDPHTGRVLAMAGGFSFYRSAFNRVTQARRQIGSSFKPFAYAAALEQGYTPTSKILDAPFVEFDVEADDFWSPGNYAEGRFYGLSTMRLGLEKSRNLMTVRLAQDIGMEVVSEFAERLKVYNHLDPYLAMSLGAGETRVIDVAQGYATFVNGGKQITPIMLDRIQDRHGRDMCVTDPHLRVEGGVVDPILVGDAACYAGHASEAEALSDSELAAEPIDLACPDCNDPVGWQGGEPPVLVDPRPQVLDPITAYQVVHMLEGVVERGTATRALRVGKPLAGKTGTTNDYKDALFMGFSPDLVVGIWVGFDTPRTLGEGEGGSVVAAPIFTEFMETALADAEALPFRAPPGVRMVRIDARTGELPGPATDVVILEAFRPGTEPGVAFQEDDQFDIFGTGGDIFGPRRSVADEGLPGIPGGETDPNATPASPEELGLGAPGAQPVPTGEAEEEPVADGLGDTW